MFWLTLVPICFSIGASYSKDGGALGIFIALMGYFAYFETVKSEDFINSPYNARQDSFSSSTVRGKIMGSGGEILAESNVDAEGKETRTYPYRNLFAHVEQVECLVLTGELGEEEYPVLSRLAGEIQELLDPPRPALAELGLEGLPASGALCRAMERYRHNARLLLEAWEKQPVSC